MNETNKKTWYLIAIVSIIVFGIIFFLLSVDDSVKNYPSNGNDIIAFGDSLVEGVGASASTSNFVSLLSSKISKSIINLGVSGNTTADGLARLSELDKYNPKIVLLLLGGNDHLKKVPIDQTFKNLGQIIENIQKRGAIVILLGVRGGLFNDKFDTEFEKISSQYQTAYVSDVLDGLFGNNKYMSDAIHPNDFGYQIIANRIYPVLYKLLK